VRVKVKAGSETMNFDGEMPFPKNPPMERFFRRFGMPEFGMPNDGTCRTTSFSRMVSL
jgi:hypothetical protein